jgi:protein-S-isoprenylcysteine O-methyltransferase Ste14
MKKAIKHGAKILLQRIFGVLLFGLGSGFYYNNNHLFFFGLSILTTACSVSFLLIRHPVALSGREEKTPSNPRSDAIVLVLYYILQFIGVFFIAGLEAKTTYRLSFLLLGTLFLLGSTFLATWALVSNPFLYPKLTVNQEAEHHVVSQGPYKVIRHPTYSSAMLTSLSFPLFFQTPFVLFTSITIAILLIIRTHLEDSYLAKNLKGYEEYQTRVRFRILVGVW